MTRHVAGAEASHGVERWIEDARNGSQDTLGAAIESVRSYLLVVAERELGRDLRSKAAPSDVVQDTVLKAQRDFASFEGCTEQEFRAWLQSIMRNCILELRRRFENSTRRHWQRGTA